MKRIAIALALVLCLFALSGCKQTTIQGTWTDEVGYAYEFKSDLTFSIDTGDEIPVGGTFTIDEENHKIVFTVVAPGGETTVTEATFAIDEEANTLTFVGADGATTVLHK